MVKYAIIILGVAVFVVRLVRIIAFNNGNEEPVPFRIFSYYNTFEVDGTDIPERRFFMRGMNRLMGLIIFCIVLASIAFVLPAILAKLGF